MIDKQYLTNESGQFECAGWRKVILEGSLSRFVDVFCLLFSFIDGRAMN